jgi:hypothetical protein
LQVLASTK